MKASSKLISMAIGGFGIGLTEFFPMGLLPEIAKGLGASVPQTGHLLSTYALGVVIGAPLLVLFSNRVSSKHLLLILMAMFTVFNGLCVLAPDLDWLMFGRFCAGLPHGAYFGVASVVAGRIAGPKKAATAFAVIITGLTVANIVGVPLATYLGQHISWRVPFGLVAAVGLITFTAISFTLESDRPKPSSGPSHLNAFMSRGVWIGVLLASIGFGGFFAFFTYVTPSLIEDAHVPSSWIPFVMSFAGCGMTVGNFVGGRLADAMSPIRAIAIVLSVIIAILLMDAAFYQVGWAMIALSFVTGAAALAVAPPLQFYLIGTAGDAPMVGGALGQAALNVGNSLGAYLAGIPLTLGYRYYSTSLVGAAMTVVSFGMALWLLRRSRSTL